MYFGFVPWRIVILFLLIEIRGFKMFAEILYAKSFLSEKKNSSFKGRLASFEALQNCQFWEYCFHMWSTALGSARIVGDCCHQQQHEQLTLPPWNREEGRPWTHSTSIYVTAPVRHEHVQKRRFWKVSWKVFGPVNNYPKEGRKSTLSPGLVHPTPLPPGILRKCLWSLKTLNESAGKMSSNTSLKREKAFKAKTEVSMSTDLEGELPREFYQMINVSRLEHRLVNSGNHLSCTIQEVVVGLGLNVGCNA